ncbi:integrase catalytic domain-containing protein [Trichonephila clavipes]|nr:integrase catalytic domain-containing protein [Trichonephila clavipes]
MSHIQSLHPKPPKHHGKRPVFIHPGLLEATLRPLQQPYDGPFKVLQRKDKVFFLDINGKRVSVSIDRCKPAFFLNTEDLQLPQTKNETPATVEPNATASTPATVESDPTASTPTQPSTRSGRKVHLPTRNTHRRDCTGRFIVYMHVQDEELPTLGNSLILAQKRLNQAIKKLDRYPYMRKLYCEFLEEYESLGHMQRIPDNCYSPINPPSG